MCELLWQTCWLLGSRSAQLLAFGVSISELPTGQGLLLVTVESLDGCDSVPSSGCVLKRTRLGPEPQVGDLAKY